METALVIEGTELMLAGMGTVFVFLTALVGATTLMSRLVIRFGGGIVESSSDEELAAVSAAVEHHRRSR